MVEQDFDLLDELYDFGAFTDEVLALNDDEKIRALLSKAWYNFCYKQAKNSNRKKLNGWPLVESLHFRMTSEGYKSFIGLS